MEISLKVELTDEQYQNLMQSSYDEIFKDPATIEAIRTMVVDQFTDYFVNGNTHRKKQDSGVYVGTYPPVRNIVEKALLDEYTVGSGYGSRTDYKPSAFLDQLIHEATEEQIEEFKANIKDVTRQILNDPRAIAQILNQVIVESIKLGLSTGNEKVLNDQIYQIETVSMLKERLFNTQNGHNI